MPAGSVGFVDPPPDVLVGAADVLSTGINDGADVAGDTVEDPSPGTQISCPTLITLGLEIPLTSARVCQSVPCFLAITLKLSPARTTYISHPIGGSHGPSVAEGLGDGELDPGAGTLSLAAVGNWVILLLPMVGGD